MRALTLRSWKLSKPSAVTVDQSIECATIQQMLRKSLADEEPTLRTPKGLNSFIQSFGHTLSARLMIPFLQAGLMVWSVYFRAYQRDSRIVSMVSQLPLDYMRRIAAEMRTIVPHHTVSHDPAFGMWGPRTASELSPTLRRLALVTGFQAVALEDRFASIVA